MLTLLLLHLSTDVTSTNMISCGSERLVYINTNIVLHLICLLSSVYTTQLLCCRHL